MAEESLSPIPTSPLEDIEKKRSSSLSDASSSRSNLDPFLASTGHDLDRVETSRSIRSRRAESTLDRTATNALSAIRSRRPVPPFTHPLAHTQTSADVIVKFDGPEDPYNALNWPFRKKVITTALYGLTTMATTFASSVFSPALEQVSSDFHVSLEVSTLGLSLFLAGLGIGPLLWAPLSEVYGRKIAVLLPYFVAGIFSFATGAAKDIQTVMITRFFAGFFGSAPVTNTGGVLGDMFSAKNRGVAIVGYAMAVVGGPTIGPLVGGAIVTSYLRWRWTEYITGIFFMSMLLLDVIFLDESYPQKLLVYKARRLRHETGNWALHARHEEWDVSIRELGKKYLVRPFQMLFTPICFLVALYASFVYGILYANLGAFPVEFEEERGWNPVVGSLPFLALLVGILFGAAVNLTNQSYYMKRFEANNNRPVPEARLPPMMFGSVIFSAGLFIFAWTSDKSIHWIAPVMGAFCIGIGFCTIFQGALNYLIDTFQRYAASAVAANTLLRSVFAAAFPLFITPMLHNMGIDWGVSVFAFFSVALIPIPFLFFTYGKRLRAQGFWSKESV